MILQVKQTAELQERNSGRCAMTVTANRSEIAAISRIQVMLSDAATVEDIRNVENLAQLAWDFAKKAEHGRQATLLCARVVLDARRKVRDTLKLMRQRGELVDGRRRKQAPSAKRSHAATVCSLRDLGLIKSQSSLYQKEGGVPPADYEAWVVRVSSTREDNLTPTGLRRLADRLEESGKPEDSRDPFAKVEGKIRRLIKKSERGLDGIGRARLSKLLESLSRGLAAVGYSGVCMPFAVR